MRKTSEGVLALISLDSKVAVSDVSSILRVIKPPNCTHLSMMKYDLPCIIDQ
jgi:hypothetical protein